MKLNKTQRSSPISKHQSEMYRYDSGSNHRRVKRDLYCVVNADLSLGLPLVDRKWSGLQVYVLILCIEVFSKVLLFQLQNDTKVFGVVEA